MSKYVVETISMFRIRYVIEAKSKEHAMDELTCKLGVDDNFKEFSQHHIDEVISSVREVTDEEYLEIFDEDNAYLSGWEDEKKLEFINVIDYGTEEYNTDSALREWEYDGTGVRVYKGTMKVYP